MRAFFPLSALALSACNPTGTFDGRLVDAMTDQPRAGVRVLAKAEKSTDMTCQVRESTTGADGTFHIDKTCPDTVYMLSLGDDTLMLADAPEVTGGQVATGPVDLHAWRAPSGSGVFKLKDDKLVPIRTFSDVASETILGTQEKVLYPTKKPLSGVPLVDDGAWLVLAGKEIIDRLEFAPLEPDQGPRRFENDVTIEDHVYVGVKFTSDTEFTRTVATVDTAHIKNVTAGDRSVRYLGQDALPQGRYVLMGKDDKRLHVVDFGTAPEPSAQADVPAE